MTKVNPLSPLSTINQKSIGQPAKKVLLRGMRSLAVACAGLAAGDGIFLVASLQVADFIDLILER